MKELTVISGKGGTGKTTLVAAFASMARNAVVIDCDVDAADLHLVLKPEIMEEHDFESGFTAVIHPNACNECGDCMGLCRFDAIDDDFRIDPLSCEGCGVCADNCPVEAIHLERDIGGKWFVSETRFGPMVHAKLGVAQENSGRLVSIVRGRAKEIAEGRGLSFAIADGSPGVGCPVISSISGTDLVLAVAEPTRSGRHDLERVIELARHFRVKVAVCVNKHDLNPEVTEGIRSLCATDGVTFVGKIPYDPVVTQAMVAGMSVTEFSNGAAAWAMSEICTKTLAMLEISSSGGLSEGDRAVDAMSAQDGGASGDPRGGDDRAARRSQGDVETPGVNI
jgi:MinD superfamily P-loop ATPase